MRFFQSSSNFTFTLLLFIVSVSYSTQVNQSNKLEEKNTVMWVLISTRITPWYQGTLLADSNTDAKGVTLLLYYWLISMSSIPDIKESKKIEKTPPTYLLISQIFFFLYSLPEFYRAMFFIISVYSNFPKSFVLI